VREVAGAQSSWVSQRIPVSFRNPVEQKLLKAIVVTTMSGLGCEPQTASRAEPMVAWETCVPLFLKMIFWVF
jgi:hypothetical protein